MEATAVRLLAASGPVQRMAHRRVSDSRQMRTMTLDLAQALPPAAPAGNLAQA
jgi:hypothetical protein